jgi:hypothetical protein
MRSSLFLEAGVFDAGGGAGEGFPLVDGSAADGLPRATMILSPSRKKDAPGNG